MSGLCPLILAGMLALLLWGVCASFSPLKNAYADELGVTVSPAEQRTALTPGKTTTGSLMLVNASDTETTTIHVYATPFYSSGDDYSTTDFAASNLYTQMVGWVEFSKTTYVLKPRQQVNLDFKVTTPNDAPPGGQYAAIMCELVPKDQALGGSGAKTVRRVASLLYGQVAGDVNEAGSVVAQSIPWFVPEGALNTDYAVQNTGNVDFNVMGHLSATPVLFGTAYDSGGASSADFTAGSYDVLPQTTRTCSQTWQQPAWGLYTVSQSVVLMGQPSAVSHLCLICPVWLLVLICVIVLLVILLIIFLIVRHRHKGRGGREERKERKERKEKKGGRRESPVSDAQALSYVQDVSGLRTAAGGQPVQPAAPGMSSCASRSDVAGSKGGDSATSAENADAHVPAQPAAEPTPTAGYVDYSAPEVTDI
jgi:hypothetical protein